MQPIESDVRAWVRRPRDAARLGLTCIAVVALMSCRRSEPHAQPVESPPAAATVTLPPTAAGAPELPALERDRLAYLFEAAERVAHTWPGLAADRTCILLLAEDAQWTINCDVAPGGFVPSKSFREHPIFAHRGGSFEVGGETRSIQQLLALTPAAAHVSARDVTRGGLPPGRPWLLLGTLEALRAFHPAFGPASTESWLSVAMHEFVHIHQLSRHEFEAHAARIEEGVLEPATLTALYAQDSDFRAAITREYQQLVAAAMRDLTPAAARRSLQRWVRSYRARSALVARRPNGSQLLESERVFTYLEGVARFVESDFLENTSQHPPVGLGSDPQFHRFAAFVGHGYPASPNRQLDDQYYYAIGYHLCVLLERIDPSWKERVDEQPGWLIGLVEELAARRAQHDISQL